MSRRSRLVVAAALSTTFAWHLAVAKVASITLEQLVTDADFIGIVRVERVSKGVPLLRRPRASALILESWKGQADGHVHFRAAPTWVCDISDAIEGEEAVVFIRGSHLLHAGRGRLPIHLVNDRRFAAFWPELVMPPGMSTEDRPDQQYKFIRSVDVGTLQTVVARLLADTAGAEK